MGSRASHTHTMQMHLSRFQHWSPGRATHSDVVEGTADCHHDLPDALLPQADRVLHDTTPLDTAVDRLDP